LFKQIKYGYNILYMINNPSEKSPDFDSDSPEKQLGSNTEKANNTLGEFFQGVDTSIREWVESTKDPIKTAHALRVTSAVVAGAVGEALVIDGFINRSGVESMAAPVAIFAINQGVGGYFSGIETEMKGKYGPTNYEI
jgi:hypothetical protein